MSAQGELPDFEDSADAGRKESASAGVKIGSDAAIHALGFRDFLLKPQLLRAIVDCGFEPPSEVQHECIPRALLGTDILCQAKAGAGKTAALVLACLQQLEASEEGVKVLVICHTGEAAYQIKREFDRLAKHLPGVSTGVVCGGEPAARDREALTSNCPHILAGTPGRVLGLLRGKDLKLDGLTHVVLDECDRCLGGADLRRDVRQIFGELPEKRQVMMSSATMGPELRAACRELARDPFEVRLGEGPGLPMQGLLHYCAAVAEKEKMHRLMELLDSLEYDQAAVFVRDAQRATAVGDALAEHSFPAVAVHSGLSRAECSVRYQHFREFRKRIMVSTDLLGHGVDIERVSMVINYDAPADSDAYLRRLGRAGSSGAKEGVAITFVSDEDDAGVLASVRGRFEVSIDDISSQMSRNFSVPCVGTCSL